MFGAIDFKAYGMNWVFDPATMKEPVPKDYMGLLNVITSLRGSDGKEHFTSATGQYYAKGDLIGKGTYGSVYKCVRRSDNANLVIKELFETGPYGPLRESIIQIIIYNVTKGLEHPEIGLRGPYVPILYEVGYDPAERKFYIISEEMRSTVYKLLRARAAAPEDLRFAAQLVLIQVGAMLDDLYRLLRFNHRDLKTDNAMYFRDDRNYVQIRLIDFGFSCITYDGVSVDGGGGGMRYCALGNRDMTQFMYEMYKYHSYLPDDFKKMLEALLTFPVDGKSCSMVKGCKGLQNWKDTYDFLNTAKVSNPNGDPKLVEDIAKIYSEKGDWQKKLRYNPKTGMAFVLPIAKPAVPVKCPPGKIYNPNTGNCVLIEGKVGKELLAAANAAPDKAVAAAAIGVQSCPVDRPIRNPHTGRCVVSCKVGYKRDKGTFKCVKKDE
jgi:hypothetical protein